MTRAYDDLKYKTGSVVSCRHFSNDNPGLNVYRVVLDPTSGLYPPGHKLEKILFAEEELQFEDKDKERDWKLKQVLK